MDLLADAVCVRERRTLCRARLTGTPGGERRRDGSTAPGPASGSSRPWPERGGATMPRATAGPWPCSDLPDQEEASSRGS
jgi:hypothetical protein